MEARQDVRCRFRHHEAQKLPNCGPTFQRNVTESGDSKAGIVAGVVINPLTVVPDHSKRSTQHHGMASRAARRHLELVRRLDEPELVTKFLGDSLLGVDFADDKGRYVDT